MSIELPNYLTRLGLGKANSLDPAEQQEGVAFLRKWGSEKCLRTICWESRPHPSDPAGWVQSWLHDRDLMERRDVDSDARAGRQREIYYRVTGRAFSSERPAKLFAQRSLMLGNRNRDTGRGGDAVAMQVEKLSLSESRIDGHFDAASQLGYQEWTCVFANHNFEDQEARFQVQLPPGGVVSRLTLWVNGEPQEAAFSSIAKVKAAYKDVVTVQRRDPVMVNVCGPDRVFVQCFPVPRNGGTMQIRLGITAPTGSGKFSLPYIVEKNFSLASKLEQQVWIQGNATFTSSDGEYKSAVVKEVQAITAQFPERAFFNNTEFTLADAPQVKVWTEDPFAADGEKFLIRTLEKRTVPALGKPIFVLDGSKSMRGSLAQIRSSLSGQEVLFAADTVRIMAADRLTEDDFNGGCDNTAALVKALSQAQANPGSVIVWIHGPQPVMLGSKQQLLQLIERGRAAAAIYDIQLNPGPNRIAEILMPTQILQAGPAARDLSAWVVQLQQSSEQSVPVYSRSATQPADGIRVWDQLARHSVFEELMRLNFNSMPELPAELTAKAARYQLVTPWSGAVVLETKQQYDKFGLTPVDPSSVPKVPNVPEPGTMALLAPLIWFGLRRKR